MSSKMMLLLALTLLLLPDLGLCGRSPEDLEKVERALLSAFGMSERPSRPSRSGRKLPDIPEFMREQYRRQTGLEVDTTNFDLPGRMTGPADRMTAHSGVVIDGVEGLKAGQAVIDFTENFDSLEGLANSLQTAKLHVYWKSKVASDFPGKRDAKFRVWASDLLKYSSNRDKLITSLEDAVMVTQSKTNWYEFDVTGPVVRWLQDSPKHKRLLLERGTLRVKNHPGVRVNPSGQFGAEAYLVLFTESPEGYRKRKKREAKQHKRKRGRGHRRNKHRMSKPCDRHEMYVDFKDVGWNDWIVAPPGYHAFYCHGQCTFPLADHMNATNHAIVQTMVNGVNPSAVPRACCVAVDHSPISMLYLDEWGKVQLRNYGDMVVESCGCR